MLPSSLLVLATCFSSLCVLATRAMAARDTNGVHAQASIAKEGVSSLTLRCQYAPGPNETVVLVTWSKVTENDVVVLFEKYSDSGGSYFLLGPWRDTSVQHDAATLADVSVKGSDVTRDDAGTYRCEITSNVKRLYSDIVATVWYGPGTSINIAPQNRSFRVKEGETITLTCTASCFPSCSFRWTCSGCMTTLLQATREATLTVFNIQRDQSGVYTCLAYNTVSRGRADVTVDVLFPAHIKELRLAGGRGRLHVTAGRSQSISCQATGNPPPRHIAWSVSGTPKHNKTFQMRHGHDESSVLMLPSLSCRDNDQYTCTASNSIGQDVRSARLQVLCPPVADPEKCCSEHTPTPETFSPSTDLTLCVLARPRPRVTWARVLSDTVTEVIDKYDVIYDDVRAKVKTWISLDGAEHNTVGVYRVTIENDRGVYVENFTIDSSEIIQTSINVTILNVTTTSFCLAWASDETNGTFILSVSARCNRTDDSSNVTHNIPGGSENDVIAYCVEALEPDTIYDVILTNEAVYGRLDIPSTVLNVTTDIEGDEEQFQSTVTYDDVRDVTSVPWMEVGVFLAVTSCLIFLVVSLIVCRRRAAARRIALDSTLKVSPPLCICNENVRLSYLEPTRQGSYVDAASCGVNGDVGFSASDVIADREQDGSRFGAGRMLGVDDLSRRPSSTPSINIYMDVLGEPSLYTNQDEEGCAGININTETYEVPVTCEQPTEGGNERRLTHEFEHYIEMSHGVGPNDDNGSADSDDDDNRSADSDDVSLASAGYDDAWCSKPNFEPAATSDEVQCSYCAPYAANGHVSPSTTLPLPVITVSDEKGRQTECGYDTPGQACTADEEHVYDLIEDSDVEE